MKKAEVKKQVKERYGQIARQSSCGCGSGCCGGQTATVINTKIGYSRAEIESVPDGADLGLGCGNPVALASLKPGETVLDMGSGAGFDCFLAAERVGPSGHVIGVDMTPEMVARAKSNASKSKYRNIEFRMGEIESLPVADNSIDVIISNCVINLSPDKPKVFREAFRVLKSGGRAMVSDIVLLKEIPEAWRNSIEVYVGCIGGAVKKEAYLDAIRRAGFNQVEVMDEAVYPLDVAVADPMVQSVMQEVNLTGGDLSGLLKSVVSIRVQAVKT